MSTDAKLFTPCPNNDIIGRDFGESFTGHPEKD